MTAVTMKVKQGGDGDPEWGAIDHDSRKEPVFRTVSLRVALITGILPAGAFALEVDGDHDGVPDSRDR